MNIGHFIAGRRERDSVEDIARNAEVAHRHGGITNALGDWSCGAATRTQSCVASNAAPGKVLVVNSGVRKSWLARRAGIHRASRSRRGRATSAPWRTPRPARVQSRTEAGDWFNVQPGEDALPDRRLRRGFDGEAVMEVSEKAVEVGLARGLVTFDRQQLLEMQRALLGDAAIGAIAEVLLQIAIRNVAQNQSLGLLTIHTRSQIVAQNSLHLLARVKQPRAHCAFRAFHRLRDVRVSHALNVMHHDDCSMGF